MESNLNIRKISKQKVEDIRSGKQIKSQMGDEKEYKKVMQDVRTEKEKKSEESGIILKRRNHILYESNYLTEKGKNLQISKEAINPKLKEVVPKKKKILYKKRKNSNIQIISNITSLNI